jgi:hypothetical protein
MNHIKIFENFNELQEAVVPRISLEEWESEVNKAVQMQAEDPVAAALYLKKIMMLHPEVKYDANYLKKLKVFGTNLGTMSDDLKDALKKASAQMDIEFAGDKENAEKMAAKAREKDEFERRRKEAIEREEAYNQKQAKTKASYLEVLYKVKSGEMSPEEGLEAMLDII